MKKSVFGRKLSRERDTRRALFKSLARSLFSYGKITTTKAKALSVVPFVEKLLKKSLDKKDSQRRRVFSLLGNDKNLVESLFKKINSEFKGLKFTSLVPLGPRQGDAAQMVSLRLSPGVFLEEKKVKKEAKTKTKKK